MHQEKILGYLSLAQIQTQIHFQLAKQLILAYIPEDTTNLNKQTITQYFDDLLHILDNDTTPSQAKFYNLLILKDISENGKYKFMSYLSGHTLLAYLFNMAIIIDPYKPVSQKGKKLFKNNPTLGNNFMLLLIQCLKFWGQKYLTNKNGSATKFAKGLQHLKKNGVQMPQEYRYVKPKKVRQEISQKRLSVADQDKLDETKVIRIRKESYRQLIRNPYQKQALLRKNSY